MFRIVHAVGDGVIPHTDLKKLADNWGVEFRVFESAVPKNTCDVWGDDISHDFLGKDLLHFALGEFEGFLDQVEEMNEDKSKV